MKLDTNVYTIYIYIYIWVYGVYIDIHTHISVDKELHKTYVYIYIYLYTCLCTRSHYTYHCMILYVYILCLQTSFQPSQLRSSYHLETLALPGHETREERPEVARSVGLHSRHRRRSGVRFLRRTKVEFQQDGIVKHQKHQQKILPKWH